MSEIYPFLPAAVEVFRVGSKTDMILRKDIKKQEQGIIDFANTLQVPFLTFSSEELNSQPGTFTESDFDKWWGYAPPTPVPVPEEKKLEDRVKELENQNATMADQLTSTQMALCDVYEQVLSVTSTATE